MRKISREEVIKNVFQALIDMSEKLPTDIYDKIKENIDKEDDERSKNIMKMIIKNADIASNKHIPLCQDTGIVVIFLEVGYDLHFDYDLYSAINEGVSKAYTEGYLRKSIVADPFKRNNTNDNTPAIIHTKLVPGSKLKMDIMMKGAGSENMSKLKMLKPLEGKDGVLDFVLEVVKEAGGKACPPLFIGIGIGGDFELAPLLAKHALLSTLDETAFEREIKNKVNELDIGPLGFGGKNTCLSVKIETHPCHIASLPVAVNLQCHSYRHRKVEL